MSIESYIPVTVQQTVNNENPKLKTVVFVADVTGFTKLTEHLTAYGSAGLELLVDKLNELFSIILEKIRKAGGDVMRFAGDAIEIYWPTNRGTGFEPRSLTDLTFEAVRCGLEIQKAIERRSPITFLPPGMENTKENQKNARSLRIKMGVSVGDVHVIHLGKEGSKTEFLAVGECLTKAHDSERLANAGEVVVTQEVVDLVGHNLVCEALEGNESFFRVANERHRVSHYRMEVKVALKKNPSQKTLSVKGSNENLRKYIPVSVMPYLQNKNSEFWLPEFRRVTTLFVNLGVDYSGDLKNTANLRSLTTKLKGAFRVVQECAERYEGSINKVFFEKDKVNLLVIFGLPPFAHGDDAKRGVLCGLSIMGSLAKSFLNGQSIGITTGLAFCGVIGGDTNSSGGKGRGSIERYQREYSVIGDSINLASRLMHAAGSEGDWIYTDLATKRLTVEHIPYADVEVKSVKGKAEGVQVFQVRNTAESSDDAYQKFSSERLRRLSVLPMKPVQLQAAMQGFRLEKSRSAQPPEMLEIVKKVTFNPNSFQQMQVKGRRLSEIVRRDDGQRPKLGVDDAVRTKAEGFPATCRRLYMLHSTVEQAGCVVAFLEGPRGTGKTHAIASIFLSAEAQQNEWRVAYATANPFFRGNLIAQGFYAWKLIILKFHELCAQGERLEEYLTRCFLEGERVIEETTDRNKLRHTIKQEKLYYLNEWLGTTFPRFKRKYETGFVDSLAQQKSISPEFNSIEAVDRLLKRETRQKTHKQEVFVEEFISLISYIMAGIAEESEEPVVAIIDDAQYLHPFSWLVCLELAKWFSKSPLFIVLARTQFPFENQTSVGDRLPFSYDSVKAKYRKQHTHLAAVDQQFSQLMHLKNVLLSCENFRLLKLKADPKETRQIIFNTKNVESCPDLLVTYLAQKTQGNALYINDALSEYMDEGLIAKEGSELLFPDNKFQKMFEDNELPVPVSVESICGELLDSLSTTQQVALKFAAMKKVPLFTMESVHRALPFETSIGTLTSEWKSLCGAGILKVNESKKTEKLYCFTQEWLKESLINRMLYKQREYIKQHLRG